MKKALLPVLFLLPFISFSQSIKQRLSKDSIAYYQKQLRQMTIDTYDSLKNSEKYKEILGKLNQNPKNYTSNFGVELTVFAGLQINNYNSLNARLKSLNVKEQKTLLMPIGVGLAFRFNKIIFGYDMTPAMIGNNSSGAYFHGYVSTNMIKAKNWIFSPQFGYGGQNFTVRIQTQSSSINFNSYFTTSANQVEVRHSTSVLDFALAVKLHVPKREPYIPLFRAGYRYGLKNKTWEVRNGTSTNAPLDRNSNFYLQLMFGFGD